MAEVGSIRKARGYIKGKLTRLEKQVSQAASETGTSYDKEQAETRLETLESIYRDFEDNQKLLLEKAGLFTDDDVTEEEAFEERYFEVKSLLKRCMKPTTEGIASRNTNAIAQLLQRQNELMQSLGRGAQGDISAAETPLAGGNDTLAAILNRQTEILDRVVHATGSTNIDARVKLPTIKLPHFDGKIEDWKCFSDSFRSIIHDKPHLSNIEKFQYLISSISGDAAKIIESIELTSQNYTAAWELLQQRYDDARSLKKKHIQCLFAMPTVAKESSKALRDLIDYTSRHLRMLKVLGLPTDTWDELIMHMIETKLDVRTLRAWEEEIESHEETKLADMLEFLKKKCQTLERIESRSTDKGEQYGKSAFATSAKLQSRASTKGNMSQRTISLAGSLSSGKCYFCNGSHFIYFCEKFLALPVSDRIKEIKRLKLCINCLKNDHFVKTCKLSSCRECSERHNTLCHIPEDSKMSASTTVSVVQEKTKSDQASVAVHHASSHANSRLVLMATAIVEATKRNGSNIPIRILLDSASEGNFITQAVHNRLGLKTNRVSQIVTGLNDVESKIHNICNVQVKSKCSNAEINVQCFIVPKITKNLPSLEIDRDKLQLPSNLKFADSEFHKAGPIDMLIGAEFFFDLLETGKMELGKNQLVLQNTKLGWVVAGSLPIALNNSISLQNTVSVLACSLKSCDVLNKNLERFWKLENYDNDNKRILANDEKKCEQYFEQTTTRTSDGRFVVKLPFRDKDLPIGNNREIALKRFSQLERVFKSNEMYRERYIKFMHEYIEPGHMSVANDLPDNSANAVYLPHHGVVKESSSSTKLRVVFDASAKNNRGTSLNDALLVGPVLQDNLIDIVVRFRFYKIALTADLQKMYRQVLVHPADRDFQRIVWRFSPSESVKDYRLNTVTYGQSCASYLAVRCLTQLATEGAKRYPLASRTLLNDTYIDDIISGANTIEDARILQDQLDTLLQEGGFKAHKWCSNSPNTLDNVPIDLREHNGNLNIDANDVIRTLGIEWNPTVDEFRFTAQTTTCIPTKRKVLSAISKLFDPLGLIGPVLTIAKVLMQGLWATKIDRDDPLPVTTADRWKNFQRDLREVDTLRVPRLVISVAKNAQFFIHGFCDASESAYGACIYIQSINEHQSEVTVKLLCSKARVAPLKKQTIPKLELCSALLLARLIDKVKRTICVKFDGIHAWSDSMVVLCWLHGDMSRWKPFVSNRTTEIVEILAANFWNHVKGSENPADLISRGAMPAQLKNNKLWWNGPSWLSDSHQSTLIQEHGWELTEDDLTNVESETRKEARVCHLNTLQPFSSRDIMDPLIKNCSTVSKIERSLAYCLRFITNCRKKAEDRILNRLTLPELDSARCEVIKYSQRLYFQDDLKNLHDKGQLVASSRLCQLQPFLDDNGIIRVGGRLQEASWKFERKHPIVLPAKCRITRLFIEREHRTLLHANQQLLLASIRQQYWPLNARNLIRQVCRSCVWCARNNPKGLTQAMGSLPVDRIKPSRAFTITGIDFAGPIITLVNKGRGRKTCKSYIALFICFSTRAIHLEATSELTTAAFLATLRRFIGRRGLPSKICSDNATNFVGAKRQLEELYAFISSSIDGTVGDALTEKGIEWSFIPPYSPHLGGLWEAGVKSCKYHLKRVMGNNLFTFEELTTVLVQIEACLNSRPLSPMSSDPLDLQPLTPGHFIVGGPLTSLPENDLSDVKINRLDRWEMIQRNVQDFWKRWAAEYVSNLQTRVKWKTRQANLQVHDLVLLKEDNLPPLKWKLGRVLETHAGKDNLIRVVTVRTATGVVKRAITKLCKLPVNDNKD